MLAGLQSSKAWPKMEYLMYMAGKLVLSCGWEGFVFACVSLSQGCGGPHLWQLTSTEQTFKKARQKLHCLS